MESSMIASAGVVKSQDFKAKPRRRDSNNCQTAKKRETDRIAQKKSRERAKNRMLELEEKLNRLQDDDKQKQISELMNTIDELRRENERLRTVTERIRGLADSAGPPFPRSGVPPASGDREKSITSPESNNTDDKPGTITSQDAGNTVSEIWWDDEPANDSPESAIQMDDTVPTSFAQDLSSETAMDLYVPPLAEINPSFEFGSFADFDTALSCGTPGQVRLGSSAKVVPDMDKWRTSNDAFIFGIDTGKRSIRETGIINSHAAYKAILWGCDPMDEMERTHPMWMALRQVDEKVFGDWQSKAQRIAMMFVCHRMLLYQCNPCKETLDRVPSFLRPRPSQETIQHPAVIDFLIWPGLRDRLVFSHKRYTSTGKFSKAFCDYLHFHWPFSDDDILVFDNISQSCKISPVFEEYAFDLKNWTMDEEFFETFTEMRHDIPSSKSRTAFAGFFDYMPMTA